MKKYDNNTIGKLIFRYFNIRNFEILKFQSFKILTPTQKSTGLPAETYKLMKSFWFFDFR